MASRVTPPSSSPTRADLVQPRTATPFARQQNGCPGSSEPPPKRRCKDPSVGGDSDVPDLHGDGLTLVRQQDGPSGQPHQPEPAPALQHENAASSSSRPPCVKPHRRQPLAEFTQLYPAAPGSTKAEPHIRQPLADFTPMYPQPSKRLAVKPHVRRPLADFTSLYRRASNPAKALAQAAANQPKEAAATGHHTPVAASTAFHNSAQSGWGHGPATATTPAPDGRHTWAPPPPQPSWNNPAPFSAHAEEEQYWMNPSNLDLFPVNPFFQQYYPGGQPVYQPREHPWSWPQSYYAYQTPTQIPPFVGHASQAHHTPVTGTADRPILLDDAPAQPVHVPAASFQGEKHQPKLNPEPSREPQTGPVRDEPNLCPEQAELVSLIEQGHNVFYTGSAGCGKSTVLKAFVRRLRDSGKKVRIIAPTGRAALNVGGSTTWTFAGWTPSSHKLPIERIKQGAHGKNVYRRLQKTDVLVIDEISMVENLHLERLNILMKTARFDPNLPVQPAFGGCQIVVTGDFCQLPPVKPFQHCLECGREMSTKVNDIGKLAHACRQQGEYTDEDKWAFRSNAWRECNFVHFHLKTIHRQNDQKFIRMLQKCRLGHQMSESEISLLMNHKCRVSQATKLYSTRKEASDVNRAAFNQLKGVKFAYWCHDNFFWRECHPHLQRKSVRGEWNNESEIASPPDTKRPLHALEDHRWAKCVELKRGMLVVLPHEP